MTTEEQTREMLAEKRLEDKQREESMLNRAEAEVSDSLHENSRMEEKARELVTDERGKEKLRSDSMGERAAEESYS